MKPYFSIIIPLYNKEKHIKDTLNGVWSQSFSDFEVIVVNDGSTDCSLKEVNTISDKRLHIFSIENQGVSHARNYGISKAKADLIVFLDADDTWHDHHLQDLKALYEEFPNCGMYCKAYHKQDDHILIPSKFKNIPNDTPWKGIVDDYFESSLINSIAWTSAVMVPKYILNTIGVFDTKITLGAGEDTDLWIRIALQYPVAFSNRISAIHQLHSDNRISNSNTNMRSFINLDCYDEQAKTNIFLKKYLDLNRFSIAIQYKLVGNTEKANAYIGKLDLKSLNKKQRFLLSQPTSVLKLFFRFKHFLKKRGILLSAFR
ncbi:glycosyltransferase family 2 protein [Psychroserpens mesophilus]|uniref:glycosyltransferase family 2 protein n=1 Tax=Psychroserpens mesophilus TaxID=325473 RepID=UPI003D646992